MEHHGWYLSFLGLTECPGHVLYHTLRAILQYNDNFINYLLLL